MPISPETLDTFRADYAHDPKVLGLVAGCQRLKRELEETRLIAADHEATADLAMSVLRAVKGGAC